MTIQEFMKKHHIIIYKALNEDEPPNKALVSTIQAQVDFKGMRKPSGAQMAAAAETAIENIINHGNDMLEELKEIKT